MLLTLLSAFLIHVVALMSPGPDFAITVQTSVRHGRRAGVWVAVGIACGLLVHIAYINVGLGALISQSIVAFSVMKIMAAAYLAYIGIKALRTKPYAVGAVGGGRAARDFSAARAFRLGFLTNALNPKAALFLLSYFTLVIDPHWPSAVLIGLIAAMQVSTVLWFGAVACFLSHARVREKFLRLGHWFDRATGAVLVALGIRVALATK